MSNAAALLPAGPGEPHAFIAISVHRQSNAEGWPSQEALACFSGWSSRAVRDQANAVERGGFLRLRRARRADGSEQGTVIEQMYLGPWGPGSASVISVSAIAQRLRRPKIRVLSRIAAETVRTSFKP
jgi:hypothetical protein